MKSLILELQKVDKTAKFEQKGKDIISKSKTEKKLNLK